MTIWSKASRCFLPPPISTASLSKRRSPGAVFLVEYRFVLGFALLIDFTSKLVAVAMPLILDSKLSAVLSHDKTEYAGPEILIMISLGLTVEPSFFKIFT